MGRTVRKALVFRDGPTRFDMHILLICAGVVALAEIGDKTQLLALVLATRFKRPVPIILGILVATLANHGVASWLGASAAEWLKSDLFKWGLALSFIAMGIWTLIPDKLEENETQAPKGSAFLATLVSFFLVEIGDKTQVATVALAAQYHSVALVAAGTTLGMLAANVPVVFLGEAAAKRLPLKAIRIVAATIFIALGLWTTLQLLAVI